jgi:hypothetical protein
VQARKRQGQLSSRAWLLGDSDSHTIPWIDRLTRFEQLEPEIVVPGHGHIGGQERIADYRAYLELQVAEAA